jgi:4-hydroxy-tetrahydrodipicolinate synthase
MPQSAGDVNGDGITDRISLWSRGRKARSKVASVRELDLCGIVAASLTPVTEGLEVDTGRLAAHVAELLGQGCSYVSVFGTTGEGASLSVAQKVAALEALAAAGVEMRRLMPAVMSAAADDAARNLAALARLGCRAAVVLPPFYYGAGGPGVVDFFDAVFARVPGEIGVVLYNIPQLSGVAFDRELVRALVARHGRRIVGLKDSTGSRETAVMLAEGFPELAIFVGDDRVLPDLLKAGGAGLIGGLPNLFARSSVEFYGAPEGPRAAELVAQARARIETVVENGDLVALKAALARSRGDPAWARLMPPLRPLADSQVTEVLEAFAATGYRYEAAAA